MPMVAPGESVQARVIFEDDSTLICRFLDGNQTEGRTQADFNVAVAKPFDLRREAYDGLTYLGWLHTYVGANERLVTKAGETDETQKITPDYIASYSIITIRRVRSLGGLILFSGERVQWEAASDRTWAVE